MQNLTNETHLAVLPDRKKKPFGAQSLLRLTEKRFALLDGFFGRDRTHIITDRVANRDHSRLFLRLNPASCMDDGLLYALESHEVTRQYFTEFNDVDWTCLDLWRTLKNRGFNGQGKLPDFAKKYGFDLPVLRRAVTVTMKEIIIEKELETEGLAAIFHPVRERLKEVSFEQLDFLCDMLRHSSHLARFKIYSERMCRYRKTYKISKRCVMTKLVILKKFDH